MGQVCTHFIAYDRRENQAGGNSFLLLLPAFFENPKCGVIQRYLAPWFAVRFVAHGEHGMNHVHIGPFQALKLTKSQAGVQREHDTIMRIKALEDELDVRLFERLGRKVVLTESGLKLLQYAKKMLEIEEEARASVSDNAASGNVTIKVPESLECHRMPGVLLAFRRKIPTGRVRILPCIAGNVAEDLRRGVTDLAFVFAYEPSARDINAAFLGTDELVAVAAPEHPLAGMSPDTRSSKLMNTEI